MTSLAMFSKSLATNLDFEAMLLAFVISIQRYTKVDNNNPLTLFHRKFWMKSMANDEVKWHSVQPQSNDDQDDTMNVDEDETMGLDDPGCYVLEISILHIVPQHLWICADYIFIYDSIQAY